MTNAAAPATDGPDRTDGPLHVAIIMDGNGRWAAARGLPRAEGHRRGVEALRRVVRAANELGILYLTIFSFSSENWSRPATEIGDLFGLLRRFIRNDLATLHRDGVRVRVIGERRLSNFLMWQAAYSELVFVPIHWPDFDKAALEGAIAEYARRERRFGGLAAKTGS